MSKKINYQKAEERYNALNAKGDNVSEQEAIEREELACLITKHAAILKLEKFKRELEQAKIMALHKILEAHNITTENQLKDIFRYVRETKPELIPQPTEPPTEQKPKRRRKKKAEVPSEQPAEQTEDQKPDGDQQTEAEQPSEEQVVEEQQTKGQDTGGTDDGDQQTEERGTERDTNDQQDNDQQTEGQAPRCQCGQTAIRNKFPDGREFWVCPNRNPSNKKDHFFQFVKD